jgi:3',5'-nucleoside bisphosphate phosphatase
MQAAAAAGVEVIALTDHDSVEGVGEALTAAAGLGLKCVTGVEISTIDPGGSDLHILGYLIDSEHPDLLTKLERSRGDREVRAAGMMEAIRQLGYEIDDDLLGDRVAEGKTVGRPHLAQAVVTHPGNRARLTREDLLDPTKFLVAYLIEGKPAFVSRSAPAVPDAIEMIHAAGGVAIWAHPFWDVEAPEDVIATLDRFVAAGIDGAEAFYVTHTREQTTLLADRCRELNLLSTGSSDFHGPGHRQFNRFRAFETFGREPDLGAIA